MRNQLSKIFAACAISSAAVVGIFGCDKEPAPAPVPQNKTPVAPPPPPGATVAPNAKPMDLGAVPEAAKDAAKDAAAPAKDAMSNMAGGAMAAMSDPSKLIDQATQYIKDNKLDLADATLKQVDGMRDKLSPTLVEGLDKAKKMLADAKAAAK